MKNQVVGRVQPYPMNPDLRDSKQELKTMTDLIDDFEQKAIERKKMLTDRNGRSKEREQSYTFGNIQDVAIPKAIPRSKIQTIHGNRSKV